MRNRLLALIMISTALVSAADSKDQKAEAPVLGYAFGEQSRQLRAVLGVPGSSRWSDPLALPEGVTDLRVAPGHRWALVALESGEVGVLTLDSLSYARLERAPLFRDADFSPNGSAVVLRSDDAFAVFSGLPEAPKLMEANAAIGRIAVSDSGSLVSLREGRLLRSSGDFVTECSETCQFGFYPAGEALAIIEGGKLMETSTDGSIRMIAEGLDTAERLLASDKSVTLASAAKLRIVDRESGTIVLHEDVAAAVTRLERMRHPAAVLLSSEEGNASWMVSMEGVRFIPARVSSAVEVKE